jgi:hypothetical protein
LQELEWQLTLSAAVARYDDLLMRHSMSDLTAAEGMTSVPTSSAELLEILRLAEVIRRKADYGRQQVVRSALRTGTTWKEIAAAGEITPPEAWDRYETWVQQQEAQHRDADYQGWDHEAAAEARRLAGPRPTVQR